VQVDGEYRKIYFYHHRNNDGLIYRQENIGSKTFERYKNREDHMIYRSVTFDASRGSGQGAANNFTLIDNWVKNVIIKKMTQKFSCSPDEEEERQLSKTEFNMDKKKVFLFYHYKDGRITNKSETFDADELLDHNKSGDQADG
jgi:hypothetical protein